MVDISVLLILIFFTFAGLRKGFWQYLSELLITGIAFLTSWAFYQSSRQILKSLMVFLWVFLGLSALKWVLVKIAHKKAGEKPSLSFVKSLGGAILGCAWGIFIAAVLVLSLELFPLEDLFEYNIKQEIQDSRTSRILNRFISLKKFAVIENLSYISELSSINNEEAQIRFNEQPETQALLEHENFKAVRDDPETSAQLKNKDIPALLNNPKIIRLINDGEFVEKLLKLDFKKAVGE
jgi:uncharacterized membrane protein required for colicin V production